MNTAAIPVGRRRIPKRGLPKTPVRRTARPWLEVLEDRTAPATVTWTGTGWDSGSPPKNNDTVVFGPGSANEVIPFGPAIPNVIQQGNKTTFQATYQNIDIQAPNVTLVGFTFPAYPQIINSPVIMPIGDVIGTQKMTVDPGASVTFQYLTLAPSRTDSITFFPIPGGGGVLAPSYDFRGQLDISIGKGGQLNFSYPNLFGPTPTGVFSADVVTVQGQGNVYFSGNHYFGSFKPVPPQVDPVIDNGVTLGSVTNYIPQPTDLFLTSGTTVMNSGGGAKIHLKGGAVQGNVGNIVSVESPSIGMLGTFSGSVNFTEITTLDVPAGSLCDFAGTLTGMSVLTLQDSGAPPPGGGGPPPPPPPAAGIIQIDGNNTGYQGSFNLFNGTLALGSSGALGTTLSGFFGIRNEPDKHGNPVPTTLTTTNAGPLTLGNRFTEFFGNFTLAAPITFGGKVLVQKSCTVTVTAAQMGLSGSLEIPSGVTLTVAGNLDVAAGGKLQIDQGGTLVVKGLLSVEPNATLTDAGVLHLQVPADGSGKGGLQNSGVITIPIGGDWQIDTGVPVTSQGTLDIKGSVESTGLFHILKKTLPFNNQPDLDIAGTFTIGQGGDLVADAGTTIDDAGGNLDVNGTLEDAGNLVAGAGSLSGGTPALTNPPGSITVTGQITVENGGDVQVQNGGSLDDNGGQVIVAQGGTVTDIDAIALTHAASVNVQFGAQLLESATFTSSADSTLTVGGRLTLKRGGSLTDSGPIQISGVLDVTHGATLTAQGPVTVAAGGELIAGGHVSLASFTTAAGFTFDFPFSGPVAGTGYQTLAPTGPLSLTGTSLKAELAGFAPALGATFTLIHGTGNVTGQFAGLPEGGVLVVNGLSFQITYHGGQGDDVVLSLMVATDTAAVVGGNLVVFGSNGNDNVTVTYAGGAFNVSINGANSPFSVGTGPGQVSPTGRVIIYGFDTTPTGTDNLTMNGQFAAEIYAGNGNTVVHGGAGGNVIYGGSSPNARLTAYAGAGTDVLIGGAGTATLYGGRGHALLIGGTVSDFGYADWVALAAGWAAGTVAAGDEAALKAAVTAGAADLLCAGGGPTWGLATAASFSGGWGSPHKKTSL